MFESSWKYVYHLYFYITHHAVLKQIFCTIFFWSYVFLGSFNLKRDVFYKKCNDNLYFIARWPLFSNFQISVLFYLRWMMIYLNPFNSFEYLHICCKVIKIESDRNEKIYHFILIIKHTTWSKKYRHKLKIYLISTTKFYNNS